MNKLTLFIILTAFARCEDEVPQNALYQTQGNTIKSKGDIVYKCVDQESCSAPCTALNNSGLAAFIRFGLTKRSKSSSAAAPHALMLLKKDKFEKWTTSELSIGEHFVTEIVILIDKHPLQMVVKMVNQERDVQQNGWVYSILEWQTLDAPPKLVPLSQNNLREMIK